MGEFHMLIEAAKRGNLEDLKAIVHSHPELINQRDELGATALHHAAFAGHRSVVRALVEQGAQINATDSQFGATPTGWAIEYLREMGGFLAIELEDLAHAILRGDVEWVTRFLKRFPALRGATDTQGRSFELLAGHLAIWRLRNYSGDNHCVKSPSHPSRGGVPFRGRRLQWSSRDWHSTRWSILTSYRRRANGYWGTWP